MSYTLQLLLDEPFFFRQNNRNNTDLDFKVQEVSSEFMQTQFPTSINNFSIPDLNDICIL